jgi:hypothetical protein
LEFLIGLPKKAGWNGPAAASFGRADLHEILLWDGNIKKL